MTFTKAQEKKMNRDNHFEHPTTETEKQMTTHLNKYK